MFFSMKLLSMAATAVNCLSSHTSSLFKFTTITTPGPNHDYLLIEIHPFLTIFLLLLLLHAPHWCLLLLILQYFALQIYLMQVCSTSNFKFKGLRFPRGYVTLLTTCMVYLETRSTGNICPSACTGPTYPHHG